MDSITTLEGMYCLFAIDLDNITFRDEFLNGGRDGGVEAAKKANAAVQKHALGSRKAKRPGIVVRVSGTLNNMPKEFLEGFQQQGNLSHVDFGFRSDDALHQELRLAAGQENCLKIFLAGISGEALRTVAGEKAVIITTLPGQGGPASSEMNVDLKDIFTSPGDIFQPLPLNLEPRHSLPDPTNAKANPASSPYNVWRADAVVVNSAGQRVDEPLPAASHGAWTLYRSTIAKSSICSDKHLLGGCERKGCQYSHDDVPPEVLLPLRHVLRSRPCSRGSRCRLVRCPLAHHCCKPTCAKAGRSGECKLPNKLHGIDPRVARREDGIVRRVVPPPSEPSNREPRLWEEAVAKSAQGQGKSPQPTGEPLLPTDLALAEDDLLLLGNDDDDTVQKWMLAGEQDSRTGSKGKNKSLLD